MCATYWTTSVQCLSHQLQLQKAVWRLLLHDVFCKQTGAPSDGDNYPQNPTNLRVELRKLNFVAKKYWHNVGGVKSWGGKSNTSSKKGCPCEERLLVHRGSSGWGRNHTALELPSCTKGLGTSQHFWALQNKLTWWSGRSRTNFLERTDKYRHWNLEAEALMWKRRNPTFAVTESTALVTSPFMDSLVFKKQTKTPKSSNALLRFISIE